MLICHINVLVQIMLEYYANLFPVADYKRNIYRSAISVNMSFIMRRCILFICEMSLKCTNIWRHIALWIMCSKTNE